MLHVAILDISFDLSDIYIDVDLSSIQMAGIHVYFSKTGVCFPSNDDFFLNAGTISTSTSGGKWCHPDNNQSLDQHWIVVRVVGNTSSLAF